MQRNLGQNPASFLEEKNCKGMCTNITTVTGSQGKGSLPVWTAENPAYVSAFKPEYTLSQCLRNMVMELLIGVVMQREGDGRGEKRGRWEREGRGEKDEGRKGICKRHHFTKGNHCIMTLQSTMDPHMTGLPEIISPDGVLALSVQPRTLCDLTVTKSVIHCSDHILVFM